MSIAKTLFTIAVSVPEENEEGWGQDVTTILTNLIDVIAATATKDAGTSRFKLVLHQDSSAQTISASETIESDASYKRVVGDAAVTADATTAIENGSSAGQIIVIVGGSDTNTVTVPDAANTILAGGASMVLGLSDTLTLMWDLSNWVELSRSAN